MKHRCIRIILALVLTAGMAVGALSGCAGRKGTYVRALREAAAVTVQPPGGGPHAAAVPAEKSEPLVSSGWLKLYFDEASKTPVVRETNSGKDWSALPLTPATPQANAGAAAITATIIVGTQRLELNSQDHAVAFGGAAAEPLGQRVYGMRVRYVLTPDAATAARAAQDKLTQTDVAFAVTADYFLEDGNFVAEAVWQNLSGNPDALIESLGVLEQFGALRQPGQDDFLLLPDGCGALLYPARTTKDQTAEDRAKESQTIRYQVYGPDPSAPEAEAPKEMITQGTDGQPLRANLPFFGVRKQRSAFLALIEQGDAQAVILARQSIPGEVPQSAVGPRFTITPTTLPVTPGADAGTQARAAVAGFAEGDSPGEGKNGTIRICYRFFFDNSATEVTMAVACREQLIRSGKLSTTKQVTESAAVSDKEQQPMLLTLLGTVPKGKNGTGLRTATRFEDALDILTRLKSKGIDSLNLRYQTALRGGPRQAAAEDVAPLLRLGGDRGLAELQSYCETTNFSLYVQVNVLSLGGGQRSRQAVTLAGDPVALALPQAAGTGVPVGLRTLSAKDTPAKALLKRLDALDGIAIGDLGSVLYASYPTGMRRQDSAAFIGRLFPALSARWKIMLDNGNGYALKTADVLADLPLDTQLRQPTANRYRAVPFVPMILHGNLDYAGPAINLAADPQQALLRAVEYGACPSYTWVGQQGAADALANESSADESSAEKAPATGSLADRLYFEPLLSAAADDCARVSSALRGLRGQRITDHSEPRPGLMLTSYDTTLIYVNYNDRPVTVDGITVPARDFLRVG
ncbi:MAG: DUF5696 domain-containing protein [Oscillospiraceae bacterium]|jgi:hypothetical protein|nr:DUF5696 domain-containing protein [Oscillospiraceae bacterium]